MDSGANFQTRIIERDIEAIGKRMDKQDSRFDRHLEIYAQNGKELTAVKMSIDSLTSAIAEVKKSSERHEEGISENRINIAKIKVTVAIYAAVASFFASAVASSIAVFFVERILS
jgi:hypothetical protein